MLESANLVHQQQGKNDDESDTSENQSGRIPQLCQTTLPQPAETQTGRQPQRYVRQYRRFGRLGRHDGFRIARRHRSVIHRLRQSGGGVPARQTAHRRAPPLSRTDARHRRARRSSHRYRRLAGRLRFGQRRKSRQTGAHRLAKRTALFGIGCRRAAYFGRLSADVPEKHAQRHGFNPAPRRGRLSAEHHRAASTKPPRLGGT